ncbi:MAG TPA: hypothetical protein VMW49_09275, partial [Candidatus Dormibacteraeota bacterium]|nr:hypothetical protein [Candidatus Dormibacteraeota bacterium]
PPASAADLLRCPLGTVTADDGSLHPGQMTVTVSCTYEPLTPVGGLAALLVGQKLDTALTLSATALQFLQG